MVSLFRFLLLFYSSWGPPSIQDVWGVDGEDVTLSVEYAQSNGTIVEEYVDGELVSRTVVSLDFDFSKTEASTAFEFGIRGIGGSITQSQNENVFHLNFQIMGYGA